MKYFFPENSPDSSSCSYKHCLAPTLCVTEIECTFHWQSRPTIEAISQKACAFDQLICENVPSKFLVGSGMNQWYSSSWTSYFRTSSDCYARKPTCPQLSPEALRSAQIKAVARVHWTQPRFVSYVSTIVRVPGCSCLFYTYIECATERTRAWRHFNVEYYQNAHNSARYQAWTSNSQTQSRRIRKPRFITSTTIPMWISLQNEGQIVLVFFRRNWSSSITPT